jgi:ABC-2 type transport system ATP-binding protein
MRAASPATVLDRISAPVLLTQGEQDSLFPLGEADATARGLAAHGTPVRVVWRPGGHDAAGVGTGTATAEAADWFRTVFAGPVSRAQPFRFSEQAAVVSAATGDASEQTLQAAGYPGVAGTPSRTGTVELRGAPQTIASPAGGTPAVITTIPGLGGISNRFDQALAQLPPAPGQVATFASARLAHRLLIAGAPTVRLVITPRDSRDVTLFAALRELAPDGASTLPAQLVAPLRLTGLHPGTPATVTVRLPAVVRNVLAGHRLLLTLSTTDFAYAGPRDARTYTVALAGGSAPVTVPSVSGTAITGGHPVIWVIAGGAVFVAALGAVGVVILRRRLVLRPDTSLADVPVAIESLTKEYAGGYRAVDDVSFRVERGQVVGLLGPNGAGKTTTLRVLVGLITPSAGRVHVFGEPVVPGAAVLARVGAFIEGPGFLPHLTGRENLRLYWAATGRPPGDAYLDTALDIAGLGPSVDRRVRTYSHGMRQRLGIAQAMLGLPEVLVLDEPTNGLDPPQIAEMREVLHDYARTGRTVVISSHLLAEVEQTCTHVVVMHKGRLVAAGATVDIAGAGGLQLVVPDPAEASRVLAAAGIAAEAVPARRALEDVFLELIDD